MQQETEQVFPPMTWKQMRYIKGLQEKGLIDSELDVGQIGKAEASEIISNAVNKAIRTFETDDSEVVIEDHSEPDEGYEEIVEEEPEPEIKESEMLDFAHVGNQHKQINGVRLGLSVKLVYSTNPPDLDRSDTKANGFKSAVKRLYNILGELENEMSVG